MLWITITHYEIIFLFYYKIFLRKDELDMCAIEFLLQSKISQASPHSQESVLQFRNKMHNIIIKLIVLTL